MLEFLRSRSSTGTSRTIPVLRGICQINNEFQYVIDPIDQSINLKINQSNNQSISESIIDHIIQHHATKMWNA